VLDGRRRLGDALTLRVGVASLIQETNTFSPLPCTLADFDVHGVFEGPVAGETFAGTNTEFGGALAQVTEAGESAVPLLRAWSMSSGRLTAETLSGLAERLRRQIRLAAPLDALVLSLHGAMAAEGRDDADLELLRSARAELGSGPPIGVCFDLHANVTDAFVDEADFLIGYRTYPHVDMAETGRRTASLLLDLLGARAAPVTRVAKRAMIVPPEAQGMDGPLGALRARADAATVHPVLDVGLFPVQPWLDVEELGFAVTVTSDGDRAAAALLAEKLAGLAWDARDDFRVELLAPVAALERARASASRPVLLSESADSPTAGAPADSPAMVRALLEHGRDLRGYTTLVDGPAVAACFAAGAGATVALSVGCTLDRRFHQPVELTGVVRGLGSDPFVLRGPFLRGSEVSMGRYAVVDAGSLSVLLTERPAYTFDPETFRHVGLPPEQADVVCVRSANLFRAAWDAVATTAYLLELPGVSTPSLRTLDFVRAPRPLYPLDGA
jgi:microcystin degradation protein MlrC